MSFHNLLSQRTRHMGANAIREILKAVAQPGMISLAGGIPSVQSFPMTLLPELMERVLATYQTAALQYDLTEGFLPLRQALAVYLADKGIAVPAEEILITSGSQGVLDAAAKVMITPGDTVAVEAPTYLGALQAFNAYEPVYICLECDDDGVLPDHLSQVLQTRPIKFIYLVPNFQNPTGRTLSMERREAVAGILRETNALLIEDDPYGDLRYRGKHLPAIKTLAPDQVIYVSSLSKVFAPGLRIGFCHAPQPIRKWLVRTKQGVDLHTGTLNQALAAEYLRGGYLRRQLPIIRRLYRPKLTAMLSALANHFPPNFRWSHPQGGMFVWVQGPPEVAMESIYQKALACHTAFVPGQYFYPQPGMGHETMRLNFTMPGESEIDTAVGRLGKIFASTANGT